MLGRMAARVLVVEDDDGIAGPLVRTLDREGYEVTRVSTGRAALDTVGADGAELVVLDLGLPDIDGLEVCRQLREEGSAVPVLVLTARGGELDRVVGLDVGADDYLAKPFGLAELLARIRALLRRSGRPVTPAAEPPVPDGLRIDSDARRAWVRGVEVALTGKEFDVLRMLGDQRGAVVTRERLMDEVWDTNWFGSTKTLDVTVGRLRQKLEGAESPTRVVTVRGVGFRLEDGPGPDDA